ncbi:hypothetical protein K3N28_19880 [Glycomyces sp. TRM65418]|uniref:hypothetical protein n=1 Tax=Glycomyces sp. TRM65418 TaxID=2867006 RepID=UPI001CE6EDA2|nr:hypothetical protein [Glycomyces sp. TRM65418]MCC3765324.1 hypothetical protein [Glycomyces sp. TRM65418]QZD54941.1 hypothetical protein K3N28_19785 [Glycomyces sp. TRM65418]
MTASAGHTRLPYGERHAWGYLTTAVAVPLVYLAVMLDRLADTAAADVEFQRPLLIAVAASIVLNMFLAPAPRKGRDRQDERDTLIAQRGVRAGFYVLAAAVLVPFALAMVEAPHFWIASGIYFAFTVAASAESIARIVGYRRGC